MCNSGPTYSIFNHCLEHFNSYCDPILCMYMQQCAAFSSCNLYNKYQFPFPSRYCELEEPASYRKEQLNNSLRLQKFYHDVEDELSWIKDREPLAASEELGHNLTEVQNLLHKHQVQYTKNAIVSTMNHSRRNNQEVGVAHEVKSPKNQLQFFMTMIMQYWLGKTKPNKAFRSTRNAFKKGCHQFF